MTNQPTNPNEQSPLGTNSCLPTQEITNLFKDQTVHFGVDKNLLLIPIQNQVNPFHIVACCFFKSALI
jgi:hypothetical protein